MNTIDEMVAGYIAGTKSHSDELPDCHVHKSAAFRHGWMNGRDDRRNWPRENARVLRRRAEMILGSSA